MCVAAYRRLRSARMQDISPITWHMLVYLLTYLHTVWSGDDIFTPACLWSEEKQKSGRRAKVMMTLMFTHSPSIDICEISHLGCIQLNLTQLASGAAWPPAVGGYREERTSLELTELMSAILEITVIIFVGFFLPIAVVPQNLSSGSTLQCVCITCCFMLVES